MNAREAIPIVSILASLFVSPVFGFPEEVPQKLPAESPGEVPGSPAPPEEKESREPEAASTVDDSEFERALAALRREYADPLKFALERESFLARLWKLAGSREAPDAAKLARLQLVAAANLESIGRDKEARALWVKAATGGGPAELRGKAFFDLGMHYFLRQRYRDAWKNYWRHVGSIDPKSKWLSRIERFRPFLEMIHSQTAPDFRGEFGALGQVNSQDLRGRWVILQFWSTSASGSYRAVETLSRIRRQFPDDSKLVVLGVNLDGERASFEEALKGWTHQVSVDGKAQKQPIITWPQFHDGQGFDSPLVRSFGIPRLPLDLLIGPEGQLAYPTPWIKGKRKKGLKNVVVENLRP